MPSAQQESSKPRIMTEPSSPEELSFPPSGATVSIEMLFREAASLYRLTQLSGIPNLIQDGTAPVWVPNRYPSGIERLEQFSTATPATALRTLFSQLAQDIEFLHREFWIAVSGDITPSNELMGQLAQRAERAATACSYLYSFAKAACFENMIREVPESLAELKATSEQLAIHLRN